MEFYNVLKCCAPNVVCGLDLNDIIRQKILNEYKDLDLLTYTIEETERLEEYLYNSQITDRGNIIEYELGELLVLSNLEGFLGHNPFIIASYQLAVNGLMRLAKKMRITFSNDFIDKWKNEPMLITHIEDLFTASTDNSKEKVWPKELDNEAFKKIIERGIEAKLIEDSVRGFKWNETKELLAYFAECISKRFELSKKVDNKGNITISWKPFEALFGVKNLKEAKQNWLRLNTIFTPNRYEEIDKLLNDVPTHP